MKKRELFSGLAMLCAIILGGGMVRTGLTFACGDEQTVCRGEEKCCEHRVATFCENETCSSVRMEGQCVPKEHSCDEFWCGNRQCQSTWLISKDVCCIYYPSSNAPEYACTASEINCRGNTARLTIRPAPTLASSELTDD
jgi:hypothetical protein